MIDIINDSFFTKCVGCAACVNVCPKNAIKFVESHHTFFYPQVDKELCIRCGKCVSVCPVNNYSNTNNLKPLIYASQANDQIRKQSSSGGMFLSLSTEAIKNKYVVYAVKFDKNFKAVFSRIDSEKNLSVCCGSKYVQAYVGETYKDVKIDLENGKNVLFFGTPCQVAGLKNVLNKNYNNLVTVDIICHGVPSQKMLDEYLAEIKKNRTIKSVGFRDKELNGWRADFLTVKFTNGEIYNKNRKETDLYEIGFQENIILRDSCENCKFCSFPRIGDITIGDFWGIEKFAKNDQKGTSLVFLNNAKGESFYVKNSFQLKENLKMDINLREIKNRVFPFYVHNKNKKTFFSNYESGKTFSESIKMAKQGKHDVGIVGIPTVENFGGSLTYIALYHTVRDLGYSCFFIERPLSSLHRPSIMEKHYDINPIPEAQIVICNDRDDLYKLNDSADTFLLGSDQMLHTNLYNNFSNFTTLDWVRDNKKKIAYASSFGHDDFTGSDEERAKISYYLKKFDSFSVRETSGVKLAREKFGINAVCVLDPVFLCNKKIYEKIANNAKRKYSGHYIFAYILDPSKEKSIFIKKLKKKLNLPIYIFSSFKYNNENIKSKWDLDINIANFDERLNCLINCDFVITDSFHGTAFSIIFNKEFVSIANEKRGITRFLNLLSLLNLTDRLYIDLKKKNCDSLSAKIDFNKINSILSKRVEIDKKWLKDSLSAIKYKPISVEDVIIEKMMEKETKILNQINTLANLLDVSYIFEENIYSYLYKLRLVQENLLILISSRDTPGMSINSKINGLLQNLGVKENLINKHWHSFNAIILNGLSVKEECIKQKKSIVDYVHNDLDIKMISAPLLDGNDSSIIINNINYSINKRGLNFVVYDLKAKKVVDSVNFDTHVEKLSCHRNAFTN